MRSEASLPQDMQALMEKYRQEMLALQKRSSLPVNPPRQAPAVPAASSVPAAVVPAPAPAAPVKAPEAPSSAQPGPAAEPAQPAVPMPPLFFELGQSEEEPDSAAPAPPQPGPEETPPEDGPRFPPLAARDEENDRLLKRDVLPPNPREEEETPEMIYDQDPMPPLDVGEEKLPPLTSEQIDKLLTGSAQLLVQVSTAKEAMPVEGALVQISRSSPEGPILYHSLVTDSNGQTTAVTLPAIDPALTLQPDLPIPALGYTVEVSKNGYDRFLSNEIILYGGIKALLPVTLIPLPDNDLS